MIHLFALLSLLLCGVCYTGFQNSSHFHNTSNRRSLLLLVFGGALLLRLLLRDGKRHHLFRLHAALDAFGQDR